MEIETNDKNQVNLFKGLSNYYDYYLNLNKIEKLVERIDSIIYKQSKIERKNINIQSKLFKNSENHEELKEEVALHFECGRCSLCS